MYSESVDDNSISWKLKYMFVKWYLSLDAENESDSEDDEDDEDGEDEGFRIEDAEYFEDQEDYPNWD